MSIWKKWAKRIPASVQLSRSRKYEVLHSEEIKSNQDVLGETRFDEKQVVLKTGQSDRELVHTYFHELIHVASFEYDANLTETQVRALEDSLYYVLKKNNIFKETE